MKTLIRHLFCIAAVALLGAGCRTSEGAYAPVNTTKYDLENQSQFVLLDKGARRSVT